MSAGAQGRLAGKRALVTAAAQGIGEAIARAFAGAGAHVLATDVNTEKLSALESVEGVETRRVDVLDAAAVASCVDAAGPFDVLASCAGFVHHGTILDCGEAAWDFSFDLNVKSMYRVVRAVLPGMIERDGGSIVCIASVASSVKGVPVRCAYGASKAAVIGLAKSVAADFIKQKVRCNAICPGTVRSPSLEERVAALGGGAEVWNAFIDRQPMGRLGTPEEVAALALYLAGDESAFTTGQAFVADGGMTL